jgi:hypothetical protein
MKVRRTCTGGADEIGGESMPPAYLELCQLDPEHRLLQPASGDAGVADGRLEPALGELLADPMMALLWASDGLDPAAARAAVRSLQRLVRDRSRRERRARPDRPEAGTVGHDLAA